jgi:hypothetical protein
MLAHETIHTERVAMAGYRHWLKDLIWRTRQGSRLIEMPEKPSIVRLLYPFPVFLIVLFLGINDPFFPFDTLRIGREFLGDLRDVFRFPPRDLDKRASAQLLERVGKDRPDPIDLFQIVCLHGLTAFKRFHRGRRPGSILARLR